MKTLFSHKDGLILLATVTILGILTMFPSGQGDASGPIEPDQCCRCHFDVCDQTQKKRYVHAPVGENDCAVCHIKDTALTGHNGASQSSQKYRWVSLNQQPDNKYWYELPEDSAGSSFLLKATTQQQQPMEREISVPDLADIPPFPRLQNNTIISDIEVTEVKRGVFISARVIWKTNRITNAKLLYGKNHLDATTASNLHWATSHEMTITGLEHQQDYIVAVSVQDISGNENISAPLAFSTRRYFSTPELSTSTRPQAMSIEEEFFKDNNRIFILLAANQQVGLKLGFSPEQTATNKATALLPSQHLVLTDPVTLTMNICLDCHPQSKGKLSHPVDILPKKGMTIPPDYHTLADGRLTCMSCHQPHAANNHYRLVRPKRKDLCLGCHQNF